MTYFVASASLTYVVGMGIGLIVGLSVVGLVIGIALLWLLMSKSVESEPARDQRPFHICPGCSAYNAKNERTCWRCEYDLAKGAIEPTGEIGLRLEKLDNPNQ